MINIKTLDQIQNQWKNLSSFYTKQDQNLSIFYLTLLNMLQIEERDSILEVGAGAGYLISHTLQRKKKEAKYYATDLTGEMLQIMCKRLDLQFNPNGQTIQQENNLFIECANGEDLKQFQNEQFDCYISNLCLQITSDPIKMLQEAHRVVKKGGVVGFTVWGEKDQSQIFTIIPTVLKELGIEQNHNERTNFHLNDRQKLIEMFQNQGFGNILCWNQFAPFNDHKNFLNFPTNQQSIKAAGDRQNEVLQAIQDRYNYFNDVLQRPVGLDGLLIIATKL